MTRVIGLVGGAGAGKSTVSGILVEKYGAVRYAFADPLKELVMRIYGLPDDAVYGTQAQKESVVPSVGLSGRQCMQIVGTAMRDTFGIDVWIEACLRRIRVERPEIAVIEDVRYVNEGAAIRRLSGMPESIGTGVTWLLDPPDRPTSELGSAHPSESEWPKIPADYVIRPERRDLALLGELVDRAAHFFHLYPAESATSELA